ncbi:MAG: SRPBCC family protein [Hyphomonadaceae bacterium]|jgi:carbon monoxide dehydrogenase subunit G|nr:SRPBCC family protein [Hyphomonadaceae bacterium]
MRIIVDSLVAAPPDTVFAAAVDIADWPRFISGIQKVELLTPGPIAVGTRFRETRIMFGRAATEEMTLAELQPPRRFLLTAFSHGTAYRTGRLFEPHAVGTRVILSFEGQPTTLLARLFAPLATRFKGTVQRHLDADLVDLKREAELRHGSKA